MHLFAAVGVLLCILLVIAAAAGVARLVLWARGTATSIKQLEEFRDETRHNLASLFDRMRVAADCVERIDAKISQFSAKET